MVKFLIHRPIAVNITFLAVLFLGIIAFKQLPVSLLPDVPIPVITVQASNSDYAATEMEQLVTQRLRRYLLQCDALKDIQSATSDGQCLITLKFEYGTNTRVAAIDVNEKVDRAMGALPEGTERPRVFKASATDIPVFYLNLTYAENNEKAGDMVILSDYAQNVIRRRLEQLDQVAMVDISGTRKAQITIEPRPEKVQSLGLEPYHFEQIFKQNNLEMGAIKVNEGYYTYTLRLSNKQFGIDELRLLPVSIGPRVFYIHDLADIRIEAEEPQGLYLANGTEAISLAIIKQSDAKVADLKDKLSSTLEKIEQETPSINLHIVRNQIALLDYSISGLRQSLLWGAVLAFLIIFAFLSDIRLPLIMALVMPVSIIISLLLFLVFDISINIISLSGIVLAVGMMIDNSIIVIDNITQFRERGIDIEHSTTGATNEVIRPLLSSALTTCAVFIPLVFIGGIAGSLFKEQAVTVSIGLGVSFWVSITLLPTLYFLLFKKQTSGIKKRFRRKEFISVGTFYNRSFDFVFRFKIAFLVFALLAILGTAFLFTNIRKESFPSLSEHEATLKISWNESINLQTNKMRCLEIMNQLKIHSIYSDAWVGKQQYKLVRDFDNEASACFLWLKADDNSMTTNALHILTDYLSANYPNAGFEKLATNNVFEKTFFTTKPPLELRVYNENTDSLLQKVQALKNTIYQETGAKTTNKIHEREYMLLRFDAVKLGLFGIDPTRLIGTLRAKLKQNPIGFYNAFNQQIPVVVKEDKQTLHDILLHETISDKDKRPIPLKAFLTLEKQTLPSTIVSGADGQYIPLQYASDSKNYKQFVTKTEQLLTKQFPGLKYDWKGQVFDNNEMIRDLTIILLISVLLLYFILAAQFESLLQPLIVLLEIPIDIGGALLLLFLFGGTLNIMSAIGMIVMTGIIINDSILKIDTINHLRRDEGMPLMDAIHEAGKRRLRPIIMTSLTTILALTPFFIGHSMGVELQKPLALAVMGGLGIGTFVSLFYIPLFYWMINKGN